MLMATSTSSSSEKVATSGTVSSSILLAKEIKRLQETTVPRLTKTVERNWQAR